MTTRERIIDESLTLFSERGFSGVSVKKNCRSGRH